MFFTLLRQWVMTPFEHYRLFHNFMRQDFFAQFAASVGGFLWLFVTPVIHIIIYTFVFGYVFGLRATEEFGQTEFVIFMMIGYLPWFAFAEAVSKSTGLLLEKAPLITKVMFPVQIIPVVGTVVPYLTHAIGFGVLLVYLAMQGYLSWLWLWLPLVFFLQFLFTIGLVAILSALCVFLRDLQQLVALLVLIWFFLTPIIYPISYIDGSIQHLFMLNPMHSFVNLYREIILLGELPLANLQVILPVSLLSYLFGGWLFVRVKHAFGDVL
ncbi:MAG: ABC transporter permease [Gammaproteobacteria bacterium]|jgi:lipopolysaccharide transport system permease protein|nr:ABC transporter permease [Gammaproteobacteria bacterium]MDP6732625.1 ABC transporter permease [Gammaproteobacteria bacterium]